MASRMRDVLRLLNVQIAFDEDGLDVGCAFGPDSLVDIGLFP